MASTVEASNLTLDPWETKHCVISGAVVIVPVSALALWRFFGGFSHGVGIFLVLSG